MNNGNRLLQQIISHMKVQFNLPEEQISTMIPPFLETLEEHLLLLEQAIVTGSLEETGRVAHTLKGALLNLGLFQCAETTQTIEASAKAGSDRADYRALLAELKTSLRELRAQDAPDPGL